MGSDAWEVNRVLESSCGKRRRVVARLQKVKYPSKSLYFECCYIYYQNLSYQETVILVNV